MKKNWKGFLFSLFVLIFATLAIIGLPLGWWPKEPDQPFVVIIFLWINQVIAAVIFGWAMKSFLPQPNYSWKEIQDENSFKIIRVGQEFEKNGMKENREDFIEVRISNFGITLVCFPTHNHWWKNGYPKPGQTWKKYGNYFVMTSSCEEPC